MKVIQLLLVLLLLLLLWIATWTKRKEEAINKQAATAPNKHILFTCWTNGSCGVQDGRSTSIRCVVCVHNRHHKFTACTTYYAHTGASASAGNHSLFHRIKSQFWIFVFTFHSNENACIFFGSHRWFVYSSYRRKRFCCTKKALLAAIFGYMKCYIRYANKSENKIAAILSASHTRMICIHFYGVLKESFLHDFFLLSILPCFSANAHNATADVLAIIGYICIITHK